MPVFVVKTVIWARKLGNAIIWPGAPTQFGGEKILEKFFTPPRPPSAPSEGGLCPATPDTPGTPLPPARPQKRGRPSPAQFWRKKAKKGCQICQKWGFWGQKWPFSGEICTFFDIFEKWPGSYAGKKRAFKPACPLGKNPPIYTVLNAAFSAPHPPLGGTSAQSAPPEGPGGPPPLGPAQARSPPSLPERLQHAGWIIYWKFILII